MARNLPELHAICFLWTHVFYVLIMPFLRLLCCMCVMTKRMKSPTFVRVSPNYLDSVGQMVFCFLVANSFKVHFLHFELHLRSFTMGMGIEVAEITGDRSRP